MKLNTAKRLIVTAAMLATLAASSVNAAPAAGGWKWTPFCYLVGRVPATFSTNVTLCRQWQRPIFYTWVWRP